MRYPKEFSSQHLQSRPWWALSLLGVVVCPTACSPGKHDDAVMLASSGTGGSTLTGRGGSENSSGGGTASASVSSGNQLSTQSTSTGGSIGETASQPGSGGPSEAEPTSVDASGGASGSAGGDFGQGGVNAQSADGGAGGIDDHSAASDAGGSGSGAISTAETGGTQNSGDGTAGSNADGGSGGATGSEASPEEFASAPVGFVTLDGGTTGGQGAEVVTVSSYAELQTYAESTTPYVIHIDGAISNGAGGGRINVQSNKSLIGVGSDAFLDGVGLNIGGNVGNIIVQNLRATLVGTSNPASVNGGDIISISGSSHHIWIDHCELYSEDPDIQTDKDKYDGLIDIKAQTAFITISYCYLHDHHKGGLVGAADDDLFADRKVTFHHNYYQDVRLRVPMYRGATGHFFNNYIVGATDATEIRAGTCVRVEKNYYEELHYSIYTPSDSPGRTERIDNIEVSRSSRAYPDDCTADIPYDYSAVLTKDPAEIPTLVPQLAGVGKL